MASYTVRLRGYRETVAGFRRIEDRLPITVKEALFKAALPVAVDARVRLLKYRGFSAATVIPIVALRGVYVRQTKRKVTGERGDFGALQMRKGFLPALYDHQASIEGRVADAFDELARSAGFY